MKHYYLLFLITVILLFIGCNKQEKRGQSNLYMIDFEQCYDMEKQMNISEIADDVEYIELRSPEDVIITKIKDIKQIDDYLFIQARLDAYLFHKNGQFIRQIGTRGQGPGEYILVYNIEIDRQKKELVISDTQQLLFYDLEGNFLRSKKIKDITYFGISDSILWRGDVIYSTSDRQKYKAVAVSLQNSEDTLAYIPNSLHGKIVESGGKAVIRWPQTRFFYHRNGLLYFKGDGANDTIWELSGMHAAPYAFIDMGKYKMPVEYEPWYSSYDTYIQNHDKYWGVSSLVEDDCYFFLLSHSKKSNSEDGGDGKSFAEFKYIVYDKKKKFGFSTKDHAGIGMTDDILGGPPIWPHWTSEEYYMSSIEAGQLLEQITEGNFSLPVSLKEQFLQMNGESNDLIILCRRKK